jgi:hypothetical protein
MPVLVPGGNPVTVVDLESRWRPLTDIERTNAEAFLGDAWWLLTGRRATLETDMEDGTVSIGNVVRVVSAMVLRILKNPEGKAQESIDDYAFRRHELVSSGLLHVTDDELRDVTPAVSRRRSRSVRLVVHGDA